MMERPLRVLFVTLGVPYPPDSGARIRDWSLLSHVARHGQVALLSLAADAEAARRIEGLASVCHTARAVVLQPRPLRTHLAHLPRHVARGWPLATYPFFRTEVAQRIRALVARFRPDIVQFEHSFLARYAEVLPRGKPVPTVLSFHNVGSRQYRRMLHMRLAPRDRAFYLLKWLLMLGWEARCAQRFDTAIVVSEAERALLHRSDPSLSVSVIENGVDTDGLRPLDPPTDPDTLLFVGTFTYPPNVDAVVHFCHTTLPLIQRERPTVRLVVVGHQPPASVRALANLPGVTIVGSAPDVRPHYQSAAVSVVPLRSGGGTRLKILESLALGRPVVSTTIGAEGLAVRDGEHLLLADDPLAFAAATLRLLDDAALAGRLASAGRALVESRYAWPAIGDRLLATYHGLLDRRLALHAAVSSA